MEMSAPAWDMMREMGGWQTFAAEPADRVIDLDA